MASSSLFIIVYQTLGVYRISPGIHFCGTCGTYRYRQIIIQHGLAINYHRVGAMSGIILTADHLNSSRELLLLNAYGKNSGTLTILMMRMFTSLLSSVFLKNRCNRVDTIQIAPWSRSADLISNTNCSSSGLYANTLKTRIALGN